MGPRPLPKDAACVNVENEGSLLSAFVHATSFGKCLALLRGGRCPHLFTPPFPKMRVPPPLWHFHLPCPSFLSHHHLACNLWDFCVHDMWFSHINTQAPLPLPLAFHVGCILNTTSITMNPSPLLCVISALALKTPLHRANEIDTSIMDGKYL